MLQDFVISWGDVGISYDVMNKGSKKIHYRHKRRRRRHLAATIAITAVVVVALIAFWQPFDQMKQVIGEFFSGKGNWGAAVFPVSSPFDYTFKVSGVLEETGSSADSSSPYWWLNSGGYLTLKNGVGKTIRGKLSSLSPWRLIYSRNNPQDTDNGYRPQNIFRLVSRSKWKDIRQQAYFRIVADNLSDSPNRNASNGLLLFNRYYDGDNLYYTGIRVDGAAVIKKKIHGSYYTMAYKKIFGGSYNHSTNPNLLPHGSWVGLRSTVENAASGGTMIKVYVDKTGNGTWSLALEAYDDGKSYGGPALTNSGYVGIRTDFMDVEFDDYRIVNL